MSEGNTIKSPLKAIRAYCIGCAGGSVYEVRKCPASDCELWVHRFGKRSNAKPRELTEEQKAKMRERLTKAREAQKKKREAKGGAE